MAVEARVDPVQLAAQEYWPFDAVVETAADGVAKGSVGVGDAVTAADVRVTNQKLRKRPDAAQFDRSARPEQKVMFTDIGTHAAECLAAAISVEVSDHANPRQELAFQGRVPSV